jgi:hypothetical protein
MPCAADRRPRRRVHVGDGEVRPRTGGGMRTRAGAVGRHAVRWAAVLVAACLLAACTGTPKTTGHHARPSSLNPLARRLLPRTAPRVIIVGGGGAFGGGSVIFIGAGGGGGSRPKITVPPIPPANSSLTIAMPLEAYQAISTQQQAALAGAGDQLVQHCMAARGFDDTSSSSPPFSSVATLEQVEVAGAGLTSVTQARTFGFARPKGAGSNQTGPAIIGFVSGTAFGQSLKAGRAYAEALFGFGPGFGGGPNGHLGCVQQANKTVYGPLVGEPTPDPVTEIAGQAANFTQSDPRVRAVIRAWSKCMARHFYHYASPSQVEGHRWKTPPNKAEIATAVADVTCKTQTNLLNTWLAVEAAYQQALIGQNLTALSGLQANFAPLLRRANAALAAAR